MTALVLALAALGALVFTGSIAAFVTWARGVSARLKAIQAALEREE